MSSAFSDAYHPRGENYDKVTNTTHFFEIFYTKDLVCGKQRAIVYYSTYDKMEKAFNKMIETGTYVREVIEWNLENSDMDFQTVLHNNEEQYKTYIYDGIKSLIKK